VPSKRGIAMVFQSYALYPHMKVYDNMAFGMKLDKTDKAEIDRRVRGGACCRSTICWTAAQAAVGRPAPARGHRPRHRARSARVPVRRTAVEPGRRAAGGRPGWKSPSCTTTSNVTMIYVTHDQVEAMTLADRIAVLRDGRLEQVGTPAELYERPNSVFVAGFIGSPKMNFLTGAHSPHATAARRWASAPNISTSPRHGMWSGEVVHAEDLGLGQLPLRRYRRG
jgi:multiple sugar transport system ATP-binding protein